MSNNANKCLSNRMVGPYQVSEVLTADPWGVACYATHNRTDHEVALQVTWLTTNALGANLTFQKQALLLADFGIPEVSPPVDIGVDEGLGYVAWDRPAGMTLNAWHGSARPHWSQAAELVAAIAQVLQRVHDAGIVHRFLHPSNVRLVERSDGPQPMLVNLAVPLNVEMLEPNALRIDLSPPVYLSPEQTWSDPSTIDGRTDIFALGILFYHLLCGRLPFVAEDNAEVVRQVREDAPQPPRQLVPTIPAELERACLRALAKAQDQRQATAGDLAGELRTALETHGDVIKLPTPAATATQETVAKQTAIVVCDCDLPTTLDAMPSLSDDIRQNVLSRWHTACHDVAEFLNGTTLECTDGRFTFRFLADRWEHRVQVALSAGLSLLNRGSELCNELNVQHNAALNMALGVRAGCIDSEVKADSLPLAGQLRELFTVLEGVAMPDKSMVSSATLKWMQRHFDCRQAQTGSEGAVTCYAVSHRGDIDHRFDVITAPSPVPIVGRNSEMAILKERWRQAKAAMGQSVLIIGPAGIGKSRLVNALEDHVVADDAAIRYPLAANLMDGSEPVIIHWYCLPRLRNVGWSPAAAFFLRFLECERNDTADTLLESLAGHLDQCPPGDPQAGPLFASMMDVPFSGRFPPLKLTAQQQKERTVSVLIDWLASVACRRPVLFVVEDLQWLDPATADLVAEMVERGLNDRILTVFTCRPEFETPWGSRSHQSQMALNRFTRRRSAELFRSLTGLEKVSPDTMAWIGDYANGIPLLVEETARQWRLSQKQHDDGRQFEPPDPLAYSKEIATATRTVLGVAVESSAMSKSHSDMGII